MKKRRKLKRKIKKTFKFFIFIFFVITFVFFIQKYKSKKYILSIEYNNKLIVNLINENDLYCILSNEEPNIDSNKWTKSSDNKCILKYNNEKNIYIKNNDEILYSSENDSYYELKDINEAYLSINDKYYPFKYYLGNYKKLKIKIDNKKIVDYENGYLKSLSDGITNIEIKNNDQNKTIKVISTKLLNKNNNFSFYDKEGLKCNQYTKEENDLIDKVLNFKINDKGYKTRAAVVEAARFLTLEFPYKINYFYENGRLGTNKVDGEGRYYHKGLYLDESRFSNISGSSTYNNIGTWGCSIYSIPIKDYDNNGLDCSGFVSWALLNGGFNPGDIGAGFTSVKDLTDLGELKSLTEKIISNNTIKVGDLLHNERNGGHIAILVGIDKSYYYVAQAIWFNEVGVVISKYNKNEFLEEFPHVVLMDKYYKKDGNLTNMW